MNNVKKITELNYNLTKNNILAQITNYFIII